MRTVATSLTTTASGRVIHKYSSSSPSQRHRLLKFCPVVELKTPTGGQLDIVPYVTRYGRVIHKYSSASPSQRHRLFKNCPVVELETSTGDRVQDLPYVTRFALCNKIWSCYSQIFQCFSLSKTSIVQVWICGC